MKTFRTPFLINPHKTRKRRGRRGRLSALVNRLRRGRGGRFSRARRRNPEGVLFGPMNPRRRRRRHATRKRRRTHARRKRSLVLLNPRRRSRRRYRMNPRSRKRGSRRRRRGMGLRGAITLGTLLSFRGLTGVVPYAITGGVAAVATQAVPGMLNINPATSPWQYRGAQAIVAVGGGMLVGQMVGRQHGFVFSVVGLAVIASELIAGPLMQAMGLGAYAPVSGAFPTWPTLGQVPYEDRMGMGAYASENIPVGAPYGP